MCLDVTVGVHSLVNQKRVRVILYKRVFRFHRKTGTEKQDRAEKQRACFSSQDFVTTSKKQAVVRTLSFFSYTRKTGTQKTGRSFQRCPRRQRYFFVASRRAGPTRTKILKRDNTTTNSRFMIDLVAEMPFEKTAWWFCAARMLVKNGPKKVFLTLRFFSILVMFWSCSI